MKKYLSLVKFSHTIFALPFALLGLFLAFHYMDIRGLELDKPWWQSLILVLICMVTARNAAMGFNRYIDRDIDAQNERTKTREIPAGVISPNKARLFVIVNVLLFIGATWFINRLCFFLSPVALAVILGYSVTKRFTALCHLILGLGLALAPVGAFIAVTGAFEWPPVILGIAVLTWVSGFDIIYALQDDQFDKSLKLHSIPVALGRERSLMVSNLLHVVSGSMIVLFGYLIEGGWLFGLGALVFLGLLLYQHLIVSSKDLSRVNLAFFTTNGIASVIFGACSIAELLMGI
ncbi:UbiA-like polyprenyltransferase [Pontibacter sp. G13]|uniref:UbiA-like polyprenyltransferase n=1 Tax=Pontibacter sp. G13 TaxID=3074898 RepID=UPI0028896CDA|nr:UbiA-like polyprenyltransferase [Pontibacter sp. G13]WNJ16636.1 UbiA-like polyprenyltransferase [Pontibacter sp. G13]